MSKRFYTCRRRWSRFRRRRRPTFFTFERHLARYSALPTRSGTTGNMAAWRRATTSNCRPQNDARWTCWKWRHSSCLYWQTFLTTCTHADFSSSLYFLHTTSFDSYGSIYCRRRRLASRRALWQGTLGKGYTTFRSSRQRRSWKTPLHS